MAECTQCCASSCPSERFSGLWSEDVGYPQPRRVIHIYPQNSVNYRLPTFPAFPLSLRTRRHCTNDMTDGMIPTATNAGRKHNPVGSNKRTDNFAAACSICERSSQSNCSTAVSKRSTGEAPLCHEEANASRTTARSPSSGHASSQETPLFNCSPADRSPAPNSPAAISPTAISARGMEAPAVWRR